MIAAIGHLTISMTVHHSKCQITSARVVPRYFCHLAYDVFPSEKNSNHSRDVLTEGV